MIRNVAVVNHHSN